MDTDILHYEKKYVNVRIHTHPYINAQINNKLTEILNFKKDIQMKRKKKIGTL